jgi:excisionase family DNA binding protein
MDYLTTLQAAQILGLTQERVLAFIKDGRLKAEHIGRAWVILRSDLEEFKKQPRIPGRPKKR